MTVLLATLATQAATKYEINVGGVEVTSDNCTNVTGGDIRFYSGGYVSYNRSTNVLTLYKVIISRDGNGEYAVHNRSCAGLTIKCIGTCDLTTEKAHTIHMDKTTTIEVTSGSTLNVNLTKSEDLDACALYSNNTAVTIKGPGTLNVSATAKSGAIYHPEAISGKGENSSSTLTFSNITASIEADFSLIYKFRTVTFGAGSDVHLRSEYASTINNVASLNFEGSEAFLYPVDAFLKWRDDGNYYDLFYYDDNGEEQYARYTAYISDNYGVLFNRSNFPDDAFRIYMKSLHNRGYLTKTEWQNLTQLIVINKGIYSMKGVEKLTYLKDLRCYNNHISSLDVSSNFYLEYLDCDGNGMTSLNVSNTNLTYLDCGPNNLTSLDVYYRSSLKTLNCNDNKLTSLTLPPTSSNSLEAIDCSNNKFTSLSITGYSNLTSLKASSNSSLTSLSCYNNKLSYLSVSECPAMKELRCYGSNHTYTTLDLTGTTALTYLDCAPAPYLTSITNLSSCTGLKTLYCYNNKMTSLSAVSSMPALELLSCHDTKITSLDVSNKSSLKTLNCYNNPNLTSLLCQNCALTTLDCKNCPAMTTLKCWNNKFTSFDVTGNTALTFLDCSPNSTLTSITGLSSCTAMKTLYCYNTGLTNLSAVSGMTNLEDLLCYDTQLTTLTVQNKSKLTRINCSGIPTLTSLTVTGNAALETLYCNSCPALTTVDASSNKLTTIDVENNTVMTTLNCSKNSNLSSITDLSTCTKLTTLDISSCNFSSFNISPFNYLQELNCYENKLTSLNVSGKTSLKRLLCYKNQLTSLNVQGCSGMTFLSTGGNKLTSLYVQGCSSLNDVRVHGNKFTEAGMSTLINSLPTRTSSSPGQLCVLNYLDYDEQNVITAAQITAAKNKYWYPKKWSGGWVDLVLTQAGDVNGDGVFNITDVTYLTQMLLVDDVSVSQYPAADYNGDGVVNITDVTEMIHYLLTE